ncbi:MAG: DUF3024 domain-containing protein [Verrucomicrobiales bacterium]|nr:DUF3024 domain-containing protein [Verrucomicrobiales bacterium]
MALEEFDQALIEVKVAEFITKHRPPERVRDKVDLSFRIEDQSVIIFELRVNWRDASQWIDSPIAKATYVKKTKDWKVYWQRADLKWHRYEPVGTVESVDDFLQVVDEDEFACFWG